MQPVETPVYKTSVEQKRRAQNAARRLRGCGPKLRDVLRENCRARIINARKNNADDNRRVQLAEVKAIMHEELRELNQDVELEEEIVDELLSDINEWYALQDHHVESLYVQPDANPNEISVLCPICLLKPLYGSNNLYICQCGVQFEYAGNMIQLRMLLQQKVNEHEQNCTQALGFFIEALPNSKKLFAICGSCDYCCSV